MEPGVSLMTKWTQVYITDHESSWRRQAGSYQLLLPYIGK